MSASRIEGKKMSQRLRGVRRLRVAAARRATLGILIGLGGLVLLTPNPAHAAPKPTCFGERATIVGTPDKKDFILGTDGDDVIVTWGGADRVHGGDGDDLICVGAGKDRVVGGAGNDRILGEAATTS